MKKVTLGNIAITTLILSLILTFLHLYWFPENFEDLLLTLLGSLLFSGIVTYTLPYFENLIRENNERENARQVLGLEMVNALRGQFQRQSDWNYQYPNLKSFFDNSHINGIGDVYQQYESAIKRYEILVDSKMIKKLLNELNEFYTEYQIGLIVCEKLFNEISRDASNYHSFHPELEEQYYKHIINYFIAGILNIESETYDPAYSGSRLPQYSSLNIRLEGIKNEEFTLIEKVNTHRNHLIQKCIKIAKLLPHI